MSEEDILKVLAAVEGVDGGCTECERHVTNGLRESFPDLNWSQLLDENGLIK